MRIRRFDLTRYGHFTDRVLDFGPRRADVPDFHIIHGANEAGKSTIFSAWLDFLFGIDPRSPYDFLHEYKMMRIGARVETSAGERDLIRVKKPSASLLDQHEQAIGDTVLAGDLGGLSRDSYRSMFSLDESSLAEGGEAILASKGEVGQLLFSASAGLSDLAARLDRIRERTDQFHRPRAQKSELADLKRRLDELKAARDAIDVAASEHARLVEARDRSQVTYEETNRRRAELRVQLSSATARLASLPQAHRLSRLRSDLAGMEIVPSAPSGWRQEIGTLTRRQVEWQTALGRVDRDIAAIETEIKAAPPRDPLLDRADALEALRELAGRALSESRDLPNRMDEIAASKRAMAAIAARLGEEHRDDLRQLLLPARVSGELRSLMSAWSGVSARVEAATSEEATATQALEDEKAHWQRLTGGQEIAEPDPHHLHDLADQLSAMRAVDVRQRLSAAERAVDDADHRLARAMSQLKPWNGTSEELARIVRPSTGILSDLGRRLTDSVAKARLAETAAEDLNNELSALKAEYASAASTPGIITDSMAEAARADREHLWKEHAAALDAPSAARFRDALDADDRLTVERMAHMSEIAQLRNQQRAIARTAARLGSAVEAHDTAREAEQSMRRQLAALVAETDSTLASDMEFAAFESWCNRLAEAQDADEQRQRAARDLDGVQQAAKTQRRNLGNTLQALGIEAFSGDLADLAAAGRRFQDSESKRRTLRDNVLAAERELERRRGQAADARNAQLAWSDEWQSVLADSWLLARGTTPTVGAMEDVLKQLAMLESELDRHDQLADRIAKMQRDIANFAGATSAFAASLGLAADTEPFALVREISERADQARKDDDRHASARKRRQELSDERDAVLAELQSLAALVARMTDHFAVETLDEVETKITIGERSLALATEISELETEIVASLGVRDIGEVETLAATADRDELARAIETLRPVIDALDGEIAQAYAELSTVEQKLAGLGSDGEAARLAEARRTVLLEIEDGARRYLELRLGALATDQALRLYRDKHQSSMMKKASEAFAQLSRGNYRNLAAQRDGQRDVLVAIGADGSSKEALQLSKGTQFQLYLALRVAGYQESATTRPPVPFIADDIMESFDEDRSQEALTQLSLMAKSGQVIYLTHHRHICEIARSVCPSVTVHGI
ncbi:AAA family ATPase [Rhizobium sp.]